MTMSDSNVAASHDRALGESRTDGGGYDRTVMSAVLTDHSNEVRRR